MDRPSELLLLKIRSLLPGECDEALVVLNQMIAATRLLLRSMPSSEVYSGRRDGVEAELNSLYQLNNAIAELRFDDAQCGIANLLRGLTFDGSSPDYFSMDDYFTFEDYDD